MKKIVQVSGKFFLLPVKNGAPKRRILIGRPGEAPFYPIDIEPGRFADCDFVGCGVSPVAVGAPLEFTLPDDCDPEIAFTDEYPAAPDGYASPERPRFHFTSRRGWLNDPNGLAYYDGAYHLFYQHNPYGTGWGNMHWGHAAGADLFHWRESADTLAPDSLGAMFSGSTVIDEGNVSGLGDGVTPPILLYYTAAGEHCVQCLAFSRDNGRTFEKYAHNPVIPTTRDARDPNLIHHAPSGRWIMALYLGDSAEGEECGKFRFFFSHDLLHWQPTAGKPFAFAPDRECPGIFLLPVEGEDPNELKMIFTAANGRYAIGRFDGDEFHAETPQMELFPRTGRGCGYAGQSFFNTPDDRHLFIAWLQPAQPPAKYFNCMMTVPVEMKLVHFPEGLRLAITPARELETLRDWNWTAEKVSPAQPLPERVWEAAPNGLSWDIEFEMNPDCDLTISCGDIDVGLNAARRRISCLSNVLEIPESASLHVRILLDAGVIEIFAGDGRIWMPRHVAMQPAPWPFQLPNQAFGSGSLRNFRLSHLASVWEA